MDVSTVPFYSLRALPSVWFAHVAGLHQATDKPDHDKRTSECVRCERTRTIIVKVGRARASTGELIR